MSINKYDPTTGIATDSDGEEIITDGHRSEDETYEEFEETIRKMGGDPRLIINIDGYDVAMPEC